MSKLKKLPPLYAIVNVTQSDNSSLLISEMLKAGVEILQIRAKGINPKKVYEMLELVLLEKTKVSSNCRLIVNDYIEIAKELPVDGVHLGQSDQSVEYARKELGEGKIIGVSTHNIDQLKEANSWPVDYIAIGPIFDSLTKSGHADVIGAENLKNIVPHAKKPVVAIGGISLQNVNDVYSAGVDSVAVISDLGNPVDLKAKVESYYAIYREINDES